MEGGRNQHEKVSRLSRRPLILDFNQFLQPVGHLVHPCSSKLGSAASSHQHHETIFREVIPVEKSINIIGLLVKTSIFEEFLEPAKGKEVVSLMRLE